MKKSYLAIISLNAPEEIIPDNNINLSHKEKTIINALIYQEKKRINKEREEIKREERTNLSSITIDKWT